MRHTVQGTHITPGTEIGPSLKYHSGSGTYEEEGKIYASRKGVLLIDQTSDGMLGTLSVQKSIARKTQFSAGDTVFGIVGAQNIQVKAISKQAAFLDILTGRGNYTSGKIPLSFVRSYDTSRVRMDESYAPGDRVRAKIVRRAKEKIGREKNMWSLSTAEEDLGVILGFSHITGILGLEIEASRWFH